MLTATKESFVEYDLWKAVVAELRSLGIEINDQDKLCEAIKNWGIGYAKLVKVFPELLDKPNLQR